MGSSGVSELFPDDDSGGGDDPTPAYAYTEIFNRLFPYYLSIGMTYDQFWNDDAELVKFWREAWRLKQEQKNHEFWLQGVYIYEAICDASPLFHDFAKKGTKAVPYRTEPYELFEKRKSERKNITKEQKSDAKAKAVMEMFMVNFNKRFEEKGGEGNGS